MNERAGTPIACSASASRPPVICSPEATTTSCSARSCWAPAISVDPFDQLVGGAGHRRDDDGEPVAGLRALLIGLATARIRSRSATEVPPNFCTTRANAPPPSQRPRDRAASRSPRNEHARRRSRRRATSGQPQARVYIVGGGHRSNPSPAEPKAHAEGGRDPRPARSPPSAGSGRRRPVRARSPGSGGMRRVRWRRCTSSNPARLGYVRDQACARFRRDPRAQRPLAGLGVLDVGCGGGLLAEPLARLGARVTGIDLDPASLRVAAEHAEAAGSRSTTGRPRPSRSRPRDPLRSGLRHGGGRARPRPGGFLAACGGLVRPAAAWCWPP